MVVVAHKFNALKQFNGVKRCFCVSNNIAVTYGAITVLVGGIFEGVRKRIDAFA